MWLYKVNLGRNQRYIYLQYFIQPLNRSMLCDSMLLIIRSVIISYQSKTEYVLLSSNIVNTISILFTFNW